MSLSNKLSCEAGSSPAAASTPTGVFNQRFEALFPRAGALGCAVCFAPPLFLLVYVCSNVGSSASGRTACRVHPTNHHISGSGRVPPCLESCPPLLPVSAPPTSLDECFFFIYLVVGLPCGSIFCQFWLFFVLKLSFFWLWEEVQCVYLRVHLGRSLFLT